MTDIVKGMFYSRRGFLSLISAAGASLGLPVPPAVWAFAGSAGPGDGGAATAVADDSRPLAELLPDGYEAYTANPNFVALYSSARTPPVKDDDGALLWVETFPDGTLHLMQFAPATPMERADAAELYDVYFGKSWRNFGELRAMVADGGRDARWAVRVANWGNPCGAIRREVATRLLAIERIDGAWWDSVVNESLTDDPAEMAHLTAEQVLRLVPRLQATVAADAVEDDPRVWEPVRPAEAGKDLRVLKLRKSGWAPQVGQTYDLEALERTFSPGVPIALPKPDRHPFMPVADGWLALIDYGRGPGRATIEGARQFVWRCGCTAADEGEACACAPEPIRENAEVAFVHLFVRAGGSDGPYAYVGLGHLPPGEHGWGLVLNVVPSIEAEFFRSLGGDLTWTACGDVPDACGEVRSRADVARVLAVAAGLRAGSIYFSRWGPDVLEVRFSGDKCVARLEAGYYPNTGYQFLTDPAFAGAAGGEPVVLSDERGDIEARADAVLPRSAAATLIEQLAAAENAPPGGWVRWKAIERPEPDEAAEPTDGDGNAA